MPNDYKTNFNMPIFKLHTWHLRATAQKKKKKIIRVWKDLRVNVSY